MDAAATVQRGYNRGNAAVKRIMQESKELAAERSRDFHSEPLEDNIFEWHFAIRGPAETDFEIALIASSGIREGTRHVDSATRDAYKARAVEPVLMGPGAIFHGRIQLPPDYPFKPPTFSFLTPNGRFEVNTKICLSISNHHPEHWQPSWSVRTALLALIAFLPTKADGAIGAIEYPPEERRALAAKSRDVAASVSGQSETRAGVTRRVHERMLESESWPSDPRPPPAQAPAAAATEGAEAQAPAGALANPGTRPIPATADTSAAAEAASSSPASGDRERAGEGSAAAAAPGPAAVTASRETSSRGNPAPSAAAAAAAPASPAAVLAASPAAALPACHAGSVAQPQQQDVFGADDALFSDDRSLFLLATFVLGAILALLVRKVYVLGDMP